MRLGHGRRDAIAVSIICLSVSISGSLSLYLSIFPKFDVSGDLSFVSLFEADPV